MTIRHHQPIHRRFVKKLHPSASCGIRKLFNDGLAAANRLNPGRAGAEIIDGNGELDAVGLKPSNRRDRIVR